LELLLIVRHWERALLPISSFEENGHGFRGGFFQGRLDMSLNWRTFEDIVWPKEPNARQAHAKPLSRHKVHYEMGGNGE
jgi:hypothetical protein